MRGAVFWDVTL